MLLLTKLSFYGIQGNLNSWLADFLSCHSECVALNEFLSSPLPVQAGVPPDSVRALFFFWFPSTIYLTLENPLHLFADDSTLYRTICHPSVWQATASSLFADLDKITNWSNTWNMSFNPDKSHTLTMSL